MMNSRLFYKSSTYDPSTELPLYILDTSFVPAISNDQQLAQLTEQLVSQMPSEEYCLVLLASGFSDYDNIQASSLKIPLNLVRFFKLIPAQKKRYLLKVYLVHGGNWIMKSVVDFFKTFWGFSKDIVHCENLTVLAQNIDITAIPISLANYLMDQIVYKNDRIIINRHLPKMFGEPLTMSNQLAFKQFSKIYNNLWSYMTTNDLDKPLTSSEWLTIIRGGELDADVLMTVNIFSDALKRDQRLCLSDFSFLEHYLIMEKFLVQLSESAQPLFPINVLTKYNYDFSRIEDLNTAFGELLAFKYAVSDRAPLQSINNASPMFSVQRVNYDNSYVLVKLVALMKKLSVKLSQEITEPHAKNHDQMRERQHLRLVLSLTKILYNEHNNQELENGFDTLFKFLCALLDNYDKIVVQGNSMKSFEKLISMDDILNFEKKGVTDSPMERKIEYKIRKSVPPTPPVARKNIGRVEEVEPETSLDDFLFDSHKPSVSQRLRNEVLRPSDQLTSKLVKYTEKDLLFQQSQEQARKTSGRFRQARGRNVSRLTKMYEQRLLDTM